MEKVEAMTCAQMKTEEHHGPLLEVKRVQCYWIIEKSNASKAAEW
jgi:hypothetical protein